MIALAYACVWLFGFSLPWESLTGSGHVDTGGILIISRGTGVIALGAALGMMLITGRVRRWHLFHVAALLFVLSAGLGLLLYHDFGEIPKKFYTYVQLFLVLWIIWELAPNRSRLIGLLVAYVAGCYVAAVGTILLYIREGHSLHRFAAGGSDPNDLAMTMVLGFPMAWYLGMTHERPFVRWIARIYLPIGLFATVLTGSRGGMLTTMVALTIVPLTLARLTPGKRSLAVALLLISGVLAVAFVPSTVVARLETTTTTVEDLSIGGRFKLWVAGLRAFLARPVMGYGPGAYKPAITPQLGALAQVAHNSYISVLVEQGLVGFVLYYAMVATVWYAVLKLPLLERRFSLVLLSTLAIAMAPLTWEDHKNVWYILAVLLGLTRAFAFEGPGTYRSRLVQPAAPPRPRARPPVRPLARPAALNPERDARA
ncbi:MAG TPA: O-antigen ligase family protein [Gemmatimonadales bacterium]|nr:O-antigen ligase family protein [Gemmatimonadales bacterium]